MVAVAVSAAVALPWPAALSASRQRSSKAGATLRSGALSASAYTSPNGYRWEQAAVYGGGYETVVVPNPKRPGVWLAGSDVNGVFLTVDGGVTWTPTAGGFEAKFAQNAGAIAWDPYNPDVAYACSGKYLGGTAGWAGLFYRSTDGGRSFSAVSDQAWCTGSNTFKTGLPGPHPRSVGRLIAPDPTRRNVVWLGTTLDGVWRSADAGSTWQPMGLQGRYIRSLVIDPSNPNTLYAAVRDGVNATATSGVYRTTNAGATWTLLSGSPGRPEELALAGSTLWVAAGPDGVWRGAHNGTDWTNLSNGIVLDTETDVMTVAVLPHPGGGSALYAGLDHQAPCTEGVGCAHLYRSVDGGVSWSPLADSEATVHTTIGGPDGPLWRQAADGRTMLDGPTTVVSDIAADPFNANTILVAARTGVWRSTNGGTDWYPIPRGINVTFHLDVAADASTPGRVIAATTDWNESETLDNGTTVEDTFTGSGDGTAVTVLGAAGAGPRPVYLGTEAGDVVLRSAPGASFTSLGLKKFVKGSTVAAIAANTDRDGVPTVLALVNRHGLWKRVGEGNWRNVKVPFSVTGATRLAWNRGSRIVYASDAGSAGVWRSNDIGETWTQIASGTGTIALSPSDTGRLWFAHDGIVERFDNADTGSVLTGTLHATRTATVAGVNVIEAAANGDVFATTPDEYVDLSTPPTRAHVYRSTDGGTTFVDIGDRASLAGILDPSAVAVTPDGTVHVVTRGSGWWIGHPDQWAKGGKVTVELDVVNNASTRSAPLVVTLKAGGKYAFASTAGAAWRCSAAGNDVTCRRRALRAGESAARLSVTLTVTGARPTDDPPALTLNGSPVTYLVPSA